MDNCLFLGNQSSGRPNNANAGSWSLEENLSYTIFIDIHKKSMTSKKKMREMQFYDKLSAFVGTRTSSQCRSHHQKLFTKFKYISKIRELFRAQIGVQNYKDRLRQGIDKMETINRTFSANDAHHDFESSQDDLAPVQEPLRETTVAELPQFVPFPSLSPMMTVLGFNWPQVQMVNGVGWVMLGGTGGSFSGSYPC